MEVFNKGYKGNAQLIDYKFKGSFRKRITIGNQKEAQRCKTRIKRKDY